MNKKWNFVKNSKIVSYLKRNKKALLNSASFLPAELIKKQSFMFSDLWSKEETPTYSKKKQKPINTLVSSIKEV